MTTAPLPRKLMAASFFGGVLVLGCAAGIRLAKPTDAHRTAAEGPVRVETAPARLPEQPTPPPASLPPAEPPKATATSDVKEPSEMRNHPRELGEWVLALPDADLKRIVGTDSLDRIVAHVTQGMMAENGAGEPGSREADGFLRRLNDRILAVK